MAGDEMILWRKQLVVVDGAATWNKHNKILWLLIWKFSNFFMVKTVPNYWSRENSKMEIKTRMKQNLDAFTHLKHFHANTILPPLPLIRLLCASPLKGAFLYRTKCSNWMAVEVSAFTRPSRSHTSLGRRRRCNAIMLPLKCIITVLNRAPLG